MDPSRLILNLLKIINHFGENEGTIFSNEWQTLNISEEESAEIRHLLDLSKWTNKTLNHAP